jgi:hypothetical protein
LAQEGMKKWRNPQSVINNLQFHLFVHFVSLVVFTNYSKKHFEPQKIESTQAGGYSNWPRTTDHGQPTEAIITVCLLPTNT